MGQVGLVKMALKLCSYEVGWPGFLVQFNHEMEISHSYENRKDHSFAIINELRFSSRKEEPTMISQARIKSKTNGAFTTDM